MDNLHANIPVISVNLLAVHGAAAGGVALITGRLCICRHCTAQPSAVHRTLEMVADTTLD